jgi:hypothetical protein
MILVTMGVLLFWRVTAAQHQAQNALDGLGLNCFKASMS